MRIGIDIGGTTIGAGTEENGKIVRRTDGPSFPKDATLEETLQQLSGRIAELMTPEVKSIGLGVPSVVDPLRGIVYDTANIPSWKEVHLKEELEKRFRVPVAVDNDANCYALGVSSFLKAMEETVVALTLGTGVGCGVVVEGKVLRGRCCGAGELCCLPYLDGTIEDYTSSKFFSLHGTTAKDAALQGRQDLFEEFGRHLAYIVNAALYAYDPHQVVFGGGIALSFSLFEKALRENLERSFAYSGNLKGLRIEAVTHPDTALLGAASLS